MWPVSRKLTDRTLDWTGRCGHPLQISARDGPFSRSQFLTRREFFIRSCGLDYKKGALFHSRSRGPEKANKDFKAITFSPVVSAWSFCGASKEKL